MPNICNTTVQFLGQPEELEKLQQALITNDRFNRPTLSYELVKDSVPGVRNSEIYKMLGIDYDKVILAGHKYGGYTEKEAETYRKKVDDFVVNQKWIGLRDSYINDRIFEFKIENSGKILTLSIEYAWYAPVAFFELITEKFDVEMKVLDITEGNDTRLIYKENDQYVDIDHNSDAVLNNASYRRACLDLGFFNEEELVVAALYAQKNDLAKELIAAYHVNFKQVSDAVDKIKENGEEISYNTFILGQDYDYENEKDVAKLDKIKESLITFFPKNKLKKHL